MLPFWRQLVTEHSVRFLPLPDEIGAAVELEFGWRPGQLPADYFPGQCEPIPCLDFSDFLVVTTTDLDDDLAHLVAQCTWETRDHLEAQYRHLPFDRSPLSYPLELNAIAHTPLPLHPGAARYFQAAQHQSTGVTR